MSALPPKADIEMARIIFGVVAPAASPHCSQYYLFEWFEQKRTRFSAANDSMFGKIWWAHKDSNLGPAD